jgi:hypothetical protein
MPGLMSANAFAVIAFPEGLLSVFIAATWWRVLRRQHEYVGPRHTASLVALALPTAALLIEPLLAGMVAPYGSLSGLDEAALRGGWPAVVAWLALGLSFATGLLPLAGLVLAMLAKGSPRIPAAIWSCVVLGTSFVNLFLAVNSFH